MKKGFTLMELLVVMALIGILVVVGLSSFISTQKKGRDAKRKNDLRQMAIAIETYANDKGHYPAGSAAGEIMGCGSDDASLCAWGSQLMDQKGTIYMVALPTEPTNTTQRYYYITDAGGSRFQIYGRLENTQDADVPKNAQNEARVFTDVNCGVGATTIYCNYGVASTNQTVEEGRTVDYE